MTMNKHLLSNHAKDTYKFALEADLTKLVKEWLSIQTNVKATKICDRYHKGISDFLLCVDGIYVAIELKAEDKKPSAQQLQFIKEVIASGGIARVCETLGEVKAIVRSAQEKSLKNKCTTI